MEHKDPDTDNGNTTKVAHPDPFKEEVNKHEKSINNSEKTARMADTGIVKNPESCKIDKEDTDKVVEEINVPHVAFPWKPRRLESVRENLSEQELGTLELFRKFRGILNKITFMNFDTLLGKVLELEISNARRLEGVIDLLYEKAIAEPIFSEVYANLCLKLSSLMVPSDDNINDSVNFRQLIISKCQCQFHQFTKKPDEKLNKQEKESAYTAEPAKKKEPQMMTDEGNRIIRFRAVANVRFIGELYKLKMLAFSIMYHCMRSLVDSLEEVNLECLCQLWTTISKHVQDNNEECRYRSYLDPSFNKLKEVVEAKSVSNRVRFMVQDVIDLRLKWVAKSAVDSNVNRGRSCRPVVEPSAPGNKLLKTRVFRSRRYK